MVKMALARMAERLRAGTRTVWRIGCIANSRGINSTILLTDPFDERVAGSQATLMLVREGNGGKTSRNLTQNKNSV
jgi:hypothetical protein